MNAPVFWIHRETGWLRAPLLTLVISETLKHDVAVVVGKSRFFLKSRNYIYTIRLLGIILLVFALLFAKDGLELLGIMGKAV